ncbi:hypothetical protein AC578_2326 [Pseudocercospora eumusae]|uniref:Uncharacterized protein n=1 Tax=Pseudocercospora eumusae TaxID=321146 RepID=A0A139HXP6_9PEZI|nr:hypothetical protein AC578_2326 [Pseudocercospora eumusae]
MADPEQRSSSSSTNFPFSHCISFNQTVNHINLVTELTGSTHSPNHVFNNMINSGAGIKIDKLQGDVFRDYNSSEWNLLTAEMDDESAEFVVAESEAETVVPQGRFRAGSRRWMTLFTLVVGVMLGLIASNVYYDKWP